MSKSLSDVGLELFRENNEDSSISVVSITYWLSTHLNDLSILIFKNYILDSTTLQPNPDLEDNDVAILKALYNIYFFKKKIDQNLGAGGFSQALSVDEGGNRVMLVNKNEIAKTYIQLKIAEENKLQALLNSLKLGSQSANAVFGQDDQSSYPGYLPKNERIGRNC